MIAGEIFEAKGKSIENVIALDFHGYDRGFIFEFTDGTELQIEPSLCVNEPRIKVIKDR